MRRVTKDLMDLPDVFKQGKALTQLEIISKGKPELIDDSIYKGTYKDREGKSQSSVRDKLNIYYHSKCAYCELLCKAEIEHYRPKKGVNEDKSHNGYYWLCYEWTNLIPSCRYCNTEGGKGNQFPIKNSRVKDPVFISDTFDRSCCNAYKNPLLNEDPLLLHPELDIPQTHFEFCWDENKKGIKITEKDNSEKGKSSIKICNLNREYLRIDRLQSVLYPVINQFNFLFNLVEEKIIEEYKLGTCLKIFFDQLNNLAQDETQTHTLLRWYIIKNDTNFETIIGPYISNENQKLIIIESFRAYQNGLL